MKALTLILASLIAQPFLPQPSGGPSLTVPDAPPPVIRVVGIAATSEGRNKPLYDEMLDPYDKVLDSLEGFDTFRLVSQEDRDAPQGEETEFVINSQYRMYVRPTGQSEAGNLMIEARIETDGPGGPMDALRARGETQPNRALTFTGMELGEGELVVIMSLIPPPSDQQQPSESEEQQEGDEQEEQEQQNQDSESQDTGDETEEQEPQEPPETEAENPEPENSDDPEDGTETDDPNASENASEIENEMDSQNIDAILESLEEIDQQEQRAAHNKQKGQPRISGEWW